MSWDFPHLNWLIDTEQSLTTLDGKHIKLWEFRFESDEDVLSAWARHFRNQYCPDDKIDFLRKGYGWSRADYLTNIKFPDVTIAPGPSIRAGDFGEILIADYLEYMLDYWVPRTRYSDKTVRNESTKGCDIIGFKIVDPKQDSGEEDTLAIFEAKTRFSRASSTAGTKSRLYDAVRDSKKDLLRKAESLNAIKQRLAYQDNFSEASKIDRFQNLADDPYKEIYGAVAIYSTEFFDPTITASFETKEHPASSNLVMLVVHGSDMMKLVNELYRRATDEA